MTTFTTEDRIIAEQNGSVTINVEPIPFAGLVTITESAPTYKDQADLIAVLKANNKIHLIKHMKNISSFHDEAKQ